MKRFQYLFIGFICIAGSIDAQSISGKITDNTGFSLAAATIEILASKDSSHIAGTVSDQDGNYSFNNVSSGTYIVKASYVEYKSVQKRVMTFKGHLLKLTLL